MAGLLLAEVTRGCVTRALVSVLLFPRHSPDYFISFSLDLFPYELIFPEQTELHAVFQVKCELHVMTLMFSYLCWIYLP